jgi:DNA-binding transcriptional MerR regulator
MHILNGTNQLCESLGITSRQLDYWITRGHLDLEATTGRGSGKARRFDENDRVLITTFATLVKAGVRPQSAQVIAEDLIEHGEALLGPYTLTARKVGAQA